MSSTRTISYQQLIPTVMPHNTLRSLLNRGQIRQVQLGGNGREALYDVESLPRRFRVKVYERYPDMEAEKLSKPFVEKIQHDTEAIRYYSQYQMADSRYLPADKQAIYANNCAILNAFTEVIRVADMERMKQSQPKLPRCSYWEQAAEVVERVMDTWPNSLPRNPRSLQRKHNEYVKSGYEVMIPNKYGNRNALKVVKADQHDLLLYLLCHYNNLDDTFVSEMYNLYAAREGYPQISTSTVRNWRLKNGRLVALGRKGQSAYRATHTATVRRRTPTSAMAMWSIDGWTVELLYQKPNSKNVTTYHHRKTMVVVLDVANDYPVGYAIGDNESPALIMAALRDALRHTEQLTGQMLMTCQVQADNYAKKTMTPIYAAISEYVVNAQVGNAKAKPVESYFSYLNRNYCKACINWSGYGVKSRNGKQPNPDALNAHRKSFPSESEVITQITRMMEQERLLKHDEYMELIDAMPERNVLPMPRDRYLYTFGVQAERPLSIEHQGLRWQLAGVRREYLPVDHTFGDWEHLKWRVRYDPADYSSVLAVSEDGTRRYLLQEKYEQPMALVDRTEGDYQELQKILDGNKEQERQDIARLQSIHEGAARVASKLQASAPTRELPLAQLQQYSMLDKMLLVDSQGQHKNEQSRERTGQEVATTRVAEEAEYEEIVNRPKALSAEEEEDGFGLFFPGIVINH